jgi:DedD protein
MSAIAEPADINVDELRRRARRRLVGAVVLALGVAVVVPMLLETDQKPLGEDVSVKIPPVDDGKFVNRLNEQSASAPKADETGAAKASPEAAAGTSASEPSPARSSKYDTHVPEAPGTATPPDATPAPASAPTTAAPAASAPTADTASAGVAKTPEPAPAAPAAKPVAAAPSPPEPRGAASASASHHEGFAVQLAAFADDKGANSLANRLKRAGYAAYTEPLKTSKGTLWRVRVGPYPSREAALAVRDKLKTEGQSGIVAAAH